MKKADFILIGAVLCVAGVLLLFLYGHSHTGAYVTVEVDGQVAETLPLDEDTEYLIESEHGTNTLIIEGGAARMSAADCPDKICVRHKKISQSGESIICLPHKVIVTVVSDREREVDL